MQKIWIIGTERFGRLAADRLTEKIKDPDLVLVDLKAEKFREAEGPGRTLIEADGAAYLAENLPKGKEHHPDWIVPAVPIHLAVEWYLLDQGKKDLRRIAILAEIAALIPENPENKICLNCSVRFTFPLGSPW